MAMQKAVVQFLREFSLLCFVLEKADISQCGSNENTYHLPWRWGASA
jgi:hypothetical protein